MIWKLRELTEMTVLDASLLITIISMRLSNSGVLTFMAVMQAFLISFWRHALMAAPASTWGKKVWRVLITGVVLNQTTIDSFCSLKNA